jgi:activator of HSP90 ATPase
MQLILSPPNLSLPSSTGTWEERDVTPWAKESLTNALLSVEYILPPTSPSPGSHAVVSKVTKLDGHASYATVRGKKRYIYEFDLTIKWILTLGEDHSLSCHGEMTFPDIDGTIELGEGYDIVNYSVEGSSPPGTGPLLDRFVRDGGLRDAVHTAIDDWVRLFRNTY